MEHQEKLMVLLDLAAAVAAVPEELVIVPQMHNTQFQRQMIRNLHLTLWMRGLERKFPLKGAETEAREDLVALEKKGVSSSIMAWQKLSKPALSSARTISSAWTSMAA